MAPGFQSLQPFLEVNPVAENSNPSELLTALLPDWHLLLQDWSASGRLTAAAQEALLLNGEPQALKELVAQWSSGVFTGIPPIVLLPSSSMPGAAGAYAISTGTIYLNQDWLATASATQAIAVLTEELGHHLDGLMNAVDTVGDEGELMAELLNRKSTETISWDVTLLEDDSILIIDHNNSTAAEASSAAESTYIDIQSKKIVFGGDWAYDVLRLTINGKQGSTVVNPGNVIDVANLINSLNAGVQASVALDNASTVIIWSTVPGGAINLTYSIQDNFNGYVSPGISLINDNSRDDYVASFTLAKYLLDISSPTTYTIQASDLSGDMENILSILNRKWYRVQSDGTKILLDGETGSSLNVSASQYSMYVNEITYIDGELNSGLVSSSIVVGDPLDNGSGVVCLITSDAQDAYQEGIWLIASSISGDPDGESANPNYTYQWFSNGVAIPSAAKESYLVPSVGAGSYVISITYTDYEGHRISVNSAAQIVSKIDNGNGSVSSITAQNNTGFNEGVTLTAGAITGDPDGAATVTSYQWYLNNAAIAGATSSSYAVGAQGFGNYSVAVTYTDAQDFSATLTSAVQAVSPINNGQGNLSAITSSNPGVFQEGVTLTAGVITGDPDGAATITAYQWHLNSTAIAGATSSSYAVGAQGLGNYSVAVTYTDAQAFSATLISAVQEVSKNANSHLFSTVTQLEWDQNLDSFIAVTTYSGANFLLAEVPGSGQPFQGDKDGNLNAKTWEKVRFGDLSGEHLPMFTDSSYYYYYCAINTGSLGGWGLFLTNQNDEFYLLDIDGNSNLSPCANVGSWDSWLPNAYYFATNVVCFVAGTQNRTPQGERAIETLQPGDLISTANGVKPIKFISRNTRHFNELLAVGKSPIRVAASAFGAAGPVADLLMSPSHALCLEGTLIEAAALLDHAGVSRVCEWQSQQLTYFNIELEQHELIWANDALTESYFSSYRSNGFSRQSWDNFDEYRALYGDGELMQELPLPRIPFSRQLPAALRAKLKINCVDVDLAELDLLTLDQPDQLRTNLNWPDRLRTDLDLTNLNRSDYSHQNLSGLQPVKLHLASQQEELSLTL
jgi:hypothetical protein